jgi:hypothetical protein
MAYTPPTTFADGTVLTSAALEGNEDALRVYLHRGIASGDFENAKWIETRHVQPPLKDSYTGLQHGVTGHQGGQWVGGTNIKLQFATKYLSGNGRPDNDSTHFMPQAAFTLDIRRPCRILYHYWWELEAGPDLSTATYQVASNDRLVWIIPFIGPYASAVGSWRNRAQEHGNQRGGWQRSYPIGADLTYTQGRGYAAKQGTVVLDYAAVGSTAMGLAVHSQIDRVGIVNWSASVEAYYL